MQNYQDTNQIYQTKIKITILQGRVPYWSLPKGLPLVEGIFASRNNLEMCPSSRGDHHHAARLLNQESSKKAHLGCCIFGIKWLACSQITCDGKGMHESPCIHNFLCPFINESWKSHCCSCVSHMIGVPSSYASMLTHSAPL